jgi:hypothetical protein
MTVSINDTQYNSIECHNAERCVFYCYAAYHYAECHYAQFWCAECHGTLLKIIQINT